MVDPVEVARHPLALWLFLAALVSCAWAIWPFRRRAKEEPPQETQAAGPHEGPDAALDFVEWGIRLAMLGKPELAAQRLERAVKSNPDDSAAHYNLGIALDQMEGYSEAVASYTRAAEIEPDSVDVRVNLGAALLASGDRRAAIKEFKKAVELAPADPGAWFGLGCAYLANSSFKKAVETFQRAAELDPSDPEIRFNLAIALRRAGSPDLADTELRGFLDMAGDRFPLHRAYAEQVLPARGAVETANGDDAP